MKLAKWLHKQTNKSRPAIGATAQKEKAMTVSTKKYVLVQVVSISKSRVVGYYDTFSAAKAALEARIMKGETNISISTRVL